MYSFLHNDTFSSSTTVGFTYVSLMFSKKYIYGVAIKYYKSDSYEYKLHDLASILIMHFTHVMKHYRWRDCAFILLVFFSKIYTLRELVNKNTF